MFDDAECRTYRCSVFVTNLDLPMLQVWSMYRDRADAENRIRELKYDFGIASFCLSKFFATEAAFRSIMVAYNLISLFRQFVLRQKNQTTLSALRFKCFALGAWISKHAHQRALKISLAREKRAWLDGLFDIARSSSPPCSVSNA
ncbi:MAG TPA: transposase [Chitinivibrionales bacterium]|nr:transposase [Chitinivibrionales bacterium]